MVLTQCAIVQGGEALTPRLQWTITEALKLKSCSTVSRDKCETDSQVHTISLQAAKLLVQQVLKRECHQPTSCALNCWPPGESRMQGWLILRHRTCSEIVVWSHCPCESNNLYVAAGRRQGRKGLHPLPNLASSERVPPARPVCTAARVLTSEFSIHPLRVPPYRALQQSSDGGC